MRASLGFVIPSVERGIWAGGGGVVFDVRRQCEGDPSVAMKPLLPFIEAGSLIVDAASGVTGAGRMPKEAPRRFARWHWMPEPLRRSMQAAIEERYGLRWEELELARIAPRRPGIVRSRVVTGPVSKAPRRSSHGPCSPARRTTSAAART